MAAKVVRTISSVRPKGSSLRLLQGVEWGCSLHGGWLAPRLAIKRPNAFSKKSCGLVR